MQQKKKERRKTDYGCRAQSESTDCKMEKKINREKERKTEKNDSEKTSEEPEVWVHRKVRQIKLYTVTSKQPVQQHPVYTSSSQRAETARVQINFKT